MIASPGVPPLRIGELLHPVPIAAAVLLVVNDHLWKGAGLLPGWLTGKLSDLAGLTFFPLLLTACGRTARWIAGRPDRGLSRRALVSAIVATGVIFSALKISPALAALAGAVPDPTDLVALPMLGVAWWVGHAEIARGTKAP